MKDQTKKNILILIVSFLIGIGILMTIHFLKGDPEFTIYKDGVEVEVFELNSGFELLIGYNESLFEACAIEHREVSNVGFVDVMLECMNNTGINAITNNISKEDLTFSWINSNCDGIEEGYQCGKIEVRVK